jgi:hypothetical protein
MKLEVRSYAGTSPIADVLPKLDSERTLVLVFGGSNLLERRGHNR